MTTFAATMTGLAGVGRIDKNDRHTGNLRFVGDELPQLVERPTFLAVAVLSACLGALTDAGQVFQGNSATRSESEVYQAAADDVVDVGGVFPFAATEPFQEAVCPLRAFALNGTPDFRVVLAESIDLRGFMDVPIRIDGHAPPAKINAKDAFYLDRLGRFALDLDVQEVAPIAALDEHGAGRLLSFECRLLPFAELGCEALPPVEQGQGEGPIGLTEGKDALVIVDAGGGEGGVGFLLDLEGGADAANGANGQVGGQAEGVADFTVAGVLKDDLVGGFLAAGDFGNVVAGASECLEGGFDLCNLFGGWGDLANDGADSLHRGGLDSHMRFAARAWAAKRFLRSGLGPAASTG
ncbi:MAG: hypothetical protein L0Z62_30355 [Gemmataceae bacterium]|nr:hypothetical protein [Gemmataceae bacterium]